VSTATTENIARSVESNTVAASVPVPLASDDDDDDDIDEIDKIPMGRVKDRDEWIQWSSQSLYQFTGRTLFNEMNVSSIREIHENERYGVLSHGIQNDPIFHYCNRAAVLQFEYTETELYQLPSRYSAPLCDNNRLIRDQIMKQSTLPGQNVMYLSNAIRQKKSGQLFLISNITLWNVYCDDDCIHRVGQTAIYDHQCAIDLE
jgi:hypothetical protein